MNKIKSLPLLPGSKIGVTAPASPVNSRELIEQAAAKLYDNGYQVELGETARPRDDYLSATDSLRQADLERMFLDESIRVIWCLRGGYGSIRLLPNLNFKLFADSPKILIGFSDITALELGLWSGIKIVTFHGPVLTSLQSDFSINQSFGMLTGQINDRSGALLAWPEQDHHLTTIKPGRARGALLGGNLATLCSLIGTKFFPNMKGVILFLEEVEEPTYRIDRLLTQLILSGAMIGVAAVLVGRCIPYNGQSEKEIITLFDEKLRALNCPSAYGYPIGHITEQWTLPQGTLAEVNTETSEVVLLESPFR